MGITVYYSALIFTPLIVYVIWKSLNSANWPVIGMLPSLLQNADRIHDYVTDAVKEMGGTVEFKGPRFADLDMLVTSDPANINHILTKNFCNYPKGPQFRKIFDLLGEGVFSVDSELWKTILSFMNHSHFPTLLETIVGRKVENGLLPVLDFYAQHQHGAHFDLQESFQRFNFDIITQLLLSKDPGSLSINSPYYPIHEAFRDAVDATFFRHVLPESCWKLQKWLGIGTQKKLTQASHLIDQFLYSMLEEVTTKNNDEDEDCCNLSMLNSYTKAPYQGITSSSSLQFLKDSLFNLFFAGRDTTSVALTWLFWLLAQNPRAGAKIRDEIMEVISLRDDDMMFFTVKESQELVYLHGALCESLRLFPPVPLNLKVAADTDVLPSGHRVKPNIRVILSFYSMGRMDAIWGEDCMEFKPERWISETGGIKHVPSYKFPAFNAGPRTCLGREMSFMLMKMVAAAVIRRYHVQLIEDHPVLPSDSIILYAKHGLKVKLITISR